MAGELFGLMSEKKPYLSCRQNQGRFSTAQTRHDNFDDKFLATTTLNFIFCTFVLCQNCYVASPHMRMVSLLHFPLLLTYICILIYCCIATAMTNTGMLK